MNNRRAVTVRLNVEEQRDLALSLLVATTKCVTEAVDIPQEVPVDQG